MNCKWIQTVLVLLIIVFAAWPALIVSETVGMWIVIVAAALILWHAWRCKNCCGVPGNMEKPGAKAAKSGKKK